MIALTMNSEGGSSFMECTFSVFKYTFGDFIFLKTLLFLYLILNPNLRTELKPNESKRRREERGKN